MISGKGQCDNWWVPEAERPRLCPGSGKGRKWREEEGKEGRKEEKKWGRRHIKSKEPS